MWTNFWAHSSADLVRWSLRIFPSRNGHHHREYKGFSTWNLTSLLNFCFPRALSCIMYPLLGNHWVWKSWISEFLKELFIFVPITTYHLCSFLDIIIYTHHNGHQTLVSLVHGNHWSTRQEDRLTSMQSLSPHFCKKARTTTQSSWVWSTPWQAQ